MRTWQGSFLDGNSLPESLFTCLYIHPEAIAALRLKAGLPSVRRVVLQDAVRTTFDQPEPDADPDAPDAAAASSTASAAGDAAPAIEPPASDLSLPQVLATEHPTILPRGATLVAPAPDEVTGTVESEPVNRAAALALAAVSTGFLAVCRAVRGVVLHADMFEDEDLNTTSFAIDTGEDVSTAHSLALLADVESLLAQVRCCVRVLTETCFGIIWLGLTKQGMDRAGSCIASCRGRRELARRCSCCRRLAPSRHGNARCL